MELSREKVLDCLQQVFPEKYNCTYSTSEWKFSSPRGFKIEAKSPVIENIGTAIWYVDEQSITASFESKSNLSREQALQEVNAFNAQHELLSNTMHVYLNDNNTIDVYIRQRLINESDDYIKKFLGSSVVVGIDRLNWWSKMCAEYSKKKIEEEKRQEEAKKKAEEEMKREAEEKRPNFFADFLEVAKKTAELEARKKEEEKKKAETARETEKANENKGQSLLKGVFGKLKTSVEKVTNKTSYPNRIINILKAVAERKKGNLTQQKDNNVFLMGGYQEGDFYLIYSKDYTNPSVDVEFRSCEFENKAKMDDMGATIVKAGINTNFSAYTNPDNTILFRKTIMIQDIEDENTAISDIEKGVDILIHAVVEVRDKWQKWPTKQEVETRRRAKTAKEEAERREREARKKAERKAAEEKRREQLIKECKLEIAQIKVKIADYNNWYNRSKDDYPKRCLEDEKEKLVKAELKLAKLEAGQI